MDMQNMHMTENPCLSEAAAGGQMDTLRYLKWHSMPMFRHYLTYRGADSVCSCMNVQNRSKEKLRVLQEMNYIQIWGICDINYGGTHYKVHTESKEFDIKIN